MSTNDPSALSPRGRWLALLAALLGWMFDGLEMGLFPVVAKPALRDLLGTSDRGVIDRWVDIITAVFLIGAATGGVIFGWLGDRLGRVRAMTLSVVTYAVFSGACGLAGAAWQMAAFRFVASLGMGGEWSLGVALVAELWPDRSRAWLAGWIGAAANFGYMIVAVVSLALSAVIGDIGNLLLTLGVPVDTKDRLVANDGWRVLMILCAAPALLTFLIRLFVPESRRWEQERERGATSHWETHDLLGVLIGAAAALGMIALLASDLPPAIRAGGALVAFAVVLVGYLYPTRRYLRRSANARQGPAASAGADTQTLRRMLLAAALSGVALIGTWGSMQMAPTWVSSLPGGENQAARAYTQMSGAAGAVVGCVIAALMGEWLGRRRTYAVLCVLSLLSVLALYRLNTSFGPVLLAWTFVAGALTASFYGWLPLYLPELFRTRVRATGQGFGFNFGRVLAAVGVMQLPVIRRELQVGYEVACPVLSLVYLVGVALIWLAPETKGKPLPEDDGH
jgi:SHS family sialic acid transporter-like MFS transporter